MTVFGLGDVQGLGALFNAGNEYALEVVERYCEQRAEVAPFIFRAEMPADLFLAVKERFDVGEYKRALAWVISSADSVKVRDRESMKFEHVMGILHDSFVHDISKACAN